MSQLQSLQISAALLSFCAVLSAQTASIHGSVTDPSSGLIPGATITVTDSHSAVHTAQSDAQGQFQVNGLPAGDYTIDVTAPGFSTFERAGLNLASTQSVALNATLNVQTQSQQVTVASGPAATLDTDASSNADALVLAKTDIDALPDDPDDLTEDLMALAGPAAGPDGGQIFIDGFTGGRLPPKNSIREIRVNQNPFAAQYDHPGHGRVEILTKPGTDILHGSAAFVFSDAALNTRNPFVTVKPPYQRRQWEGEVGGPLGKKTSYYLDFERRDIAESAIVNALVLDSLFNTQPLHQAVPTPLTGMDASGKIDRQLSTNHTLTARYNFARDTNDNAGVGGFALPNRAFQRETDENTFQLVETGVLSGSIVNEARFRYRHVNTDSSGGVNAPITSVLDSFSAGGSSNGISFNRQSRYELQNFTTWVKGTHSVKWGGLLRGVTMTDQLMNNYYGSFAFTSLDAYRITLQGIQSGLSPAQIRAQGGGASQFSLTAGNPLAQLNQFDYGFYAQDDWRMAPSLTLSGGLRYEAQTHAHDWADIAPRLGIAWAPGATSSNPAKNVIRAGFGIFYDRLAEAYTLNAERQNGISQQVFLIRNPDFYPSVPPVSSLTASLQPQTIRETDTHWRAPQLFQAAVSWERQLPKHVTLATSFIRSQGVHELRSRNINAPLPGTGVLPYGGVNAIYLFETSGIYRQNQFVASINGRVNPNLSFNASYVYGRAMSNTDGAYTYPANQYDLSTEYSRAGFDIRHRVQLNGSYTMKHGIRFSPFVTLTTGRPYNITTGTDLNGDGIFLDRPGFALNASTPGVISTPYGLLDPVPQPGEKIIPRNLGEGPGLVAVNFRVSKIFNLGEAKSPDSDPRQIVVSFNARNILNHPNFAPPDGNLSSPLFGQSTSLAVADGSSGNRRIDLQLRYNF